jgi:hypothetical protein
MKIGFTGTRAGMNDRQRELVKAVLDSLAWAATHGPLRLKERPEFYHGGADGADEEADAEACLLGYVITVHPCPGVTADEVTGTNGRGTFNGHEVAWREVLPPLVRNRNIVDECDLLIAAPKRRAEERRSGTWATVRYARKVGRPTLMVWP